MRSRRRVPWFVLAFGAVGILIAYGGVTGARSAAQRSEYGDSNADRRAPRFFGAAGAFGHGDPSRAAIDPYAPPGLPEGVTIDPETGWMVGLDLAEVDGATRLTWADLAGPTYAEGTADLSARLRSLDGEQVTIVGFLKAIYAVEDIRTFLLVGSHLACCFGTFPGPEGVIEVTLDPDGPATTRVVEPVQITGTLRFRAIHDQYRGRRRVALLFHLKDARLEVLDPRASAGR